LRNRSGASPRDERAAAAAARGEEGGREGGGEETRGESESPKIRERVVPDAIPVR